MIIIGWFLVFSNIYENFEFSSLRFPALFSFKAQSEMMKFLRSLGHYKVKFLKTKFIFEIFSVDRNYNSLFLQDVENWPAKLVIDVAFSRTASLAGFFLCSTIFFEDFALDYLLTPPSLTTVHELMKRNSCFWFLFLKGELFSGFFSHKVWFLCQKNFLERNQKQNSPKNFPRIILMSESDFSIFKEFLSSWTSWKKLWSEKNEEKFFVRNLWKKTMKIVVEERKVVFWGRRKFFSDFFFLHFAMKNMRLLLFEENFYFWKNNSGFLSDMIISKIEEKKFFSFSSKISIFLFDFSFHHF